MKILSFGEVLWDVFPDRKEIGGAPFNFSAHACRQGASVDIVSAIGKDDLSDLTLKEIERHKMSSKFVGVSEFPTGVCRVELNESGTPSYNLEMPVAYDDIKLNSGQLEQISKGEYDCLYYGTLALRNIVSRNTLEDILNLNCFKNVFVDVNIRQNYYSSDLLIFVLENATIIKISREELGVIASQIGLDYEDYSVLAENLFQRFLKAQTIIITLDKEGAAAFERGEKQINSKNPVNKAVSTVGAGDSFSATFLVSRDNGISLKDSLDRAVTVSDFVVTQWGAVPEYDLSEIIRFDSNGNI